MEYHSYFDPKTNSRVLDKQLVSQAGAIQRRGRAGRRSPGICYNLYSKKTFDDMSKYGIPNILESDLTGLSLNLLALRDIRTIEKLKDLYKSFIEPPTPEFINISIKNLSSLDLIEDSQITDLGFKINRFRDVEPLEAKILFTAYQYDCVDEVSLLISAIGNMSNKIGNLIKAPKVKNKLQQEEMAQEFRKILFSFCHPTGDHMSILNIFSKYMSLEGVERDAFVKDNFLDGKTIKKAIKDGKKLTSDTNKIFNRYPKFKVNKNLEEKIFISMATGYINNVAFYDKEKNAYSTNTARDLKLSRETFLRSNPKSIFYNELFRQNGKYELNITSTVPRYLQ